MQLFKRYFLITCGSLLVLAGIIITPLPIPTGILMIALGLSLLIGQSLWLRNNITKARSRYRHFSDRLNSIKTKLPSFARVMIERTDPLPYQTAKKCPEKNHQDSA